MPKRNVYSLHLRGRERTAQRRPVRLSVKLMAHVEMKPKSQEERMHLQTGRCTQHRKGVQRAKVADQETQALSAKKEKPSSMRVQL